MFKNQINLIRSSNTETNKKLQILKSTFYIVMLKMSNLLKNHIHHKFNYIDKFKKLK